MIQSMNMSMSLEECVEKRCFFQVTLELGQQMMRMLMTRRQGNESLVCFGFFEIRQDALYPYLIS